MALSLNRLSSRKVQTFAFLCALALIIASPAFAQSSDSSTSGELEPIFVVQAKIDTPHDTTPEEEPTEGAAHDDWTPNITDLEKSLAATFSAWHVRNVFPATTAPTAQPPAPNVYVLELTVDELYSAERDRWNDDAGRFDLCRAVGAELSLRLIHLQSGRVVSDTSERPEYCSDDSDSKEIDAERGAVYIAVENLGERFIEAWAAGRFEQDLKAAQAPTSFDRLLHTLNMYGMTVPGITLGLAFSILLFLYTWFAVSHNQQIGVLNEAWIRMNESQASLASKQRAVHHEWDQEPKKAIALSLKTYNFSDAACRTAAAVTRDEMLASAAQITAREAERIADAKVRSAHYEKLAAYGASTSALTHAELVNILRKADEWEYRVLQEAKKQALEAPQNDRR